MTTLFSDDRLPMVGELSNNIRNFDRERMHLFDEKNAFDALIQDGMFPFYSNSYMVVIGDDTEVAYAKYSNDRSPEKAIKTEIVMENGVKKFRKHAADERSAEHIRNIYTSYQLLSKRYEGSKLEINHCELVDGKIPYVELEYVEGITLAEMLDEYLLKDDEEGFKELFKEYVERISYGAEEPITDYDMIFANILVNGDKWTVIDYEWTMPEKIDTKEIVFRSLYCYLLENGKRSKCDKEWIFSYLGIKPEEVEEYQRKEVLFQKSVMGDRKSMAQLIQDIGGKVFNVDYWRREIKERLALVKERQIQVYKDRGEGYKIENLSYVNNISTNEQEIKIEINISENVQNLRIDPADEPCICKIKEVTFNGVDILESNRSAVSTNGQRAGETTVFATADPNIYVCVAELEKKEINTISMSLEIMTISGEMCEDIAKNLKPEEKVDEKREVKRKLRLWSRN